MSATSEVAVPDVPPALIEALRLQRLGCEWASPLYATILDAVLADVEAGGVCAEVFADPGPEPLRDAMVLRFLGGIHRVVLSGRAADLAAFYPSAGGAFTAGVDDPGPAFLATVAHHRDEAISSLEQPVQTNEVGRTAALLLGFFEVAAATGMPLRVLEIGASAGLNLRWDHFRFEGGDGGTAFGPPDSSVVFADPYRDPLPRLDRAVTVAAREGCDRSPIDVGTEEGRLLLRSFVWPDQAVRLAALDAALAVAAAHPVTLTRADAAEWLDERLAEPQAGVATVVYHSIVWQYLPTATQVTILGLMEAVGRAATDAAPVAWLRFEPAADLAKGAEVRLRLWPAGAGDERLVARTGYHGKPIRAVPLP
jgi:hypothetical protein